MCILVPGHSTTHHPGKGPHDQVNISCLCRICFGLTSYLFFPYCTMIKIVIGDSVQVCLLLDCSRVPHALYLILFGPHYLFKKILLDIIIFGGSWTHDCMTILAHVVVVICTLNEPSPVVGNLALISPLVLKSAPWVCLGSRRISWRLAMTGSCTLQKVCALCAFPRLKAQRLMCLMV